MIETDLVLFARAPEPGRVKTRLVPPLTPEEAAEVYEASLRDVIATAGQVGGPPRILYDDSPGAAAYFESAFPRLERAPQCGGDLGRRLCDAFEASFARGAKAVVAIGADSPTLPGGYVSDGLAATREVEGALGPARDGGYYLIGLRRDSWPRAAALFRDIPWSTERVCRETLQRAIQTGLHLRLLREWYDIDRFDDLVHASNDAAADSHLRRLIATRGAAWGVNTETKTTRT